MNEEILINVTPQETRVAMMQQGVVQELPIQPTTTVSFDRDRGVYLAVSIGPVMVRILVEGLEIRAHLSDSSFSKMIKSDSETTLLNRSRLGGDK